MQNLSRFNGALAVFFLLFFIHSNAENPPSNSLVDVSFVEQKSGISVLNIAGNYDETVDGTYNIAARQAVAQALYSNIPDVHDFLVVFTTFPVDSGERAGFYNGVKNDVNGIGIEPFNHQQFFGSDQLQGYVDMTEMSDWQWDVADERYDATLDTLTHEMMHRWGPKISFMKSGQPSDLLVLSNRTYY